MLSSVKNLLYLISLKTKNLFLILIKLSKTIKVFCMSCNLHGIYLLQYFHWYFEWKNKKNKSGPWSTKGQIVIKSKWAFFYFVCLCYCHCLCQYPIVIILNQRQFSFGAFWQFPICQMNYNLCKELFCFYKVMNWKIENWKI